MGGLTVREASRNASMIPSAAPHVIVRSMRPRHWDWDDDVGAAVLAGAAILGAWIRGARLRSGLTQRQLAWRSGLAQSTVSRLETGKLPGMRLRTLAGIIGVLNGRIRYPHAFDGPPAATRRLPGQPLDRA